MAIETSPAEPGRYSYACLLRLRAVEEITGLKRSSIYRGIAAGTFPGPCKLSERASAWSSIEIQEWVTERIALRDASERAA